MNPTPDDAFPPQAVRCAIYTRKSSSEGLEQAFSSLDAQREAALAYIHSQQPTGWLALPQRYEDGGWTGSNLDRPALQQLLADIRAGRIAGLTSLSLLCVWPVASLYGSALRRVRMPTA
jgi:DNA invertase Pin-like site-specific DNA recombinase